MCLRNATNGIDWASQFEGQKYITCYKVLEVDKNRKNKIRLFSPYQGTIYYPGVIVSSRKFDNSFYKLGECCGDILENDSDFWSIKRGIHVLTTIEEATGYMYEGKEVILSVRCKVEDLIGYNKDLERAVFNKVYVEQRSYDRALKRAAKVF